MGNNQDQDGQVQKVRCWASRVGLRRTTWVQEGTPFDALAASAQAFGVTPWFLRRWLDEGYEPDRAVRGYKVRMRKLDLESLTY